MADKLSEAQPIYQTDFGPVRLGPAADALPKRKNGDFDLRYATARSFVRDMNRYAQRVFLSHRRKTLDYFNG